MSDPVTLPDHVTMAPVTSNHHGRAGYDADGKHLYIDFAREGQPAKIYRYSNFGPEDWAAYQNAESKGKHFLARIKPETEKFPFVKVAAP